MPQRHIGITYRGGASYDESGFAWDDGRAVTLLPVVLRHAAMEPRYDAPCDRIIGVGSDHNVYVLSPAP